MCGICGIAGKYDKQKPVIENMMKSIYHRGPDGGGNYIDEDVALGFRRLSIIDLDCGNQPMFNETGEVVIVFNGEIYNYQELTKELQAKGHVFANHSDTECLIHASVSYTHLEMLRGIVFDRMIVSKGRKTEIYEHPVIALTGEHVSSDGSYQMILHPDNRKNQEEKDYV